MNYLKQFRLDEGMTQKDIAEKLNYSLSMYSKIESGNRNISRKFALKFVETFPSADLKKIFLP